MMYERDYNNDMYYSRQEGIEEGIAIGEARGEARGNEEEKLSNAKNLKSAGVALETIATCIGLDIEPVEAL